MLPLQIGRCSLAVHNGRRTPCASLSNLLAPPRCPCQRRTAILMRQDGSLSQIQEQTEEERRSDILKNVTRQIQSLGGAGKPKEAIKALAGLASLGVEPDTRAATALVQACARSRNMELAQSVFNELFDTFLKPDEVTFVCLLRGYGSMDPPQWAKIDGVLTTMQGTHKIDPTAMSYNALLEICVRTNDLDRGMDIIDRMQRDGVELNEFSLDIVQPRRALRSYLRKAFSDSF